LPLDPQTPCLQLQYEQFLIFLKIVHVTLVILAKKLTRQRWQMFSKNLFFFMVRVFIKAF
jgi:hypothetical protein